MHSLQQLLGGAGFAGTCTAPHALPHTTPSLTHRAAPSCCYHSSRLLVPTQGRPQRQILGTQARDLLPQRRQLHTTRKPHFAGNVMQPQGAAGQ